MKNEIIVAIISAICSSIVTSITSLLLNRHKEKREDRINAQKERKQIFENRPEMSIIAYKDYTERTGYGTRQKCDINVIAAHIENVIVLGEKKNKRVEAQYRIEDFNPEEWCCVIYTFQNVGKTDISAMDIICNYKKDTCIFDCDSSVSFVDNHLLNYSVCFDQKIRASEAVTVKICYHKDRIVSGMLSPIMSIGLEDSNGRYWMQPLFAPAEKIYDSRMVSYKEYISNMRADLAMECFKNPMLW